MPTTFSDETIISQYMETPPVVRDLLFGYQSPDGWWRRDASAYGERFWKPNRFTLDMLHKAERRLPDALWAEYALKILEENSGIVLYEKRLVHATLPQKTRALAAVLRGIVEKPETAA